MGKAAEPHSVTFHLSERRLVRTLQGLGIGLEISLWIEINRIYGYVGPLLWRNLGYGRPESGHIQTSD